MKVIAILNIFNNSNELISIHKNDKMSFIKFLKPKDGLNKSRIQSIEIDR